MKVKNSRMETLKMLISSQELSSQEEVLKALSKEGYLKQRGRFAGRTVARAEPRRLRTDTGHPLPRLETTESCQSRLYEW